MRSGEQWGANLIPMNTLMTISVADLVSPELVALAVTWVAVLVCFEGLRRVRTGRDARHPWRRHA